jgi:hypothetical protein
MIPETMPYGRSDALFDLLLSSSVMVRPWKDLCKNRELLRTIFSSETFYYGWKSLNMEKLINIFHAEKKGLEKLDARDRTLALARLILVIRLQSGIFTFESAAEYLRNIGIVTESEIEKEVLAASSSPARALEGISLVLIEQIVKDLSRAKGDRIPNRRARKLLMENKAIPLTLIQMKIPS